MILIRFAKDYIRKYGKDVLISIIIFLIILAVWRFLEIVSVGKVEPSFADSIIALILNFSLLFNYFFVRDMKKKKGDPKCHCTIINVNAEKKYQ